MEWEAFLMRCPNYRRVEDIPSDWQPPPIGSSAEVKRQLEAAFPDQDHFDGQTTVKKNGSWVKFTYAPSEATAEPVKSIYIRSNADVGTIPILQSASDRLKCRTFDLQTGEFADFGERTEASVNGFAQLCRRVKREKRWAFGLAVVVVATFHALQDAGRIPPVISLSKPATIGYAFLGLIFLNVLAFLSSVVGALRQVGKLKGEVDSKEEQEKMEEAILGPTLQGQGFLPLFVCRFFHIPISALWGMIAGSVLAWVVSLMFF